ncbi:hypothetical protein FNYG_01378 [Fusarium nygamai]|uniref:Uncharacterized protein n=1 Tax=Gibberella nygamai TaxID=42673 RepID=A0A2K0WSB3_GIBNY|nr:hypothetical protein FNYG_01378 [Fusarium nygamai]
MALPANLIAELQYYMDSILLPPNGKFWLAQDPATATWGNVESVAAHPQHGTRKPSKEEAMGFEIKVRTALLDVIRHRDERTAQNIIYRLPNNEKNEQAADSNMNTSQNWHTAQFIPSWLRGEGMLVDISPEELEEESDEENEENENEDEDESDEENEENENEDEDESEDEDEDEDGGEDGGED